mgnify:CR=1 FL=1
MNIINRKNSSNAVSNIKNITHLKLSVLLSSILLMLAFAFFIYASFNPKDTAASSKKAVYSDSGSGSDSNSSSDSGSNSSYNSGSDGINGGSIKGNCVAGKKALPIYCIQTDEKKISISFDAAWGADDTIKLLDILDRYNVKATFFVTNGKPDYQNLIAQEAQRGHTVAIHSASHDYAKIYQSVDAYFADFDEMNSIITAQTGKAADLVRFPGGSSNTISKKYCYGIMSQLVCAVEERGFRYCDWNVSSGDAGGTTSTSQVVANVIAGIKGNNVSVVLQHDIKNFSVDAVEQIIQWGLSEGYTFLPIISTTPMSHHGVNN